MDGFRVKQVGNNNGGYTKRRNISKVAVIDDASSTSDVKRFRVSNDGAGENRKKSSDGVVLPAGFLDPLPPKNVASRVANGIGKQFWNAGDFDQGAGGNWETPSELLIHSLSKNSSWCGRDVQHHNIVNDMMMTSEITYHPRPGPDGISSDESNIVANVTMGFIKDAKAHIDVQGFNVYHKNRLIKMRAAVWDVSKHFPTAIISGRSREKVYSFVKLNEVYYSGSHGMDTMGPTPKNKSYDDKYHYKTIDEEGNEFIVFQPAKDFLPAIQKMLTEMRERTKDIQGVVIEDNRFCLSVHYRHVKDKEDSEKLEEEVKLMLGSYPEFHMTRGKMGLEIRPSIEWNKGHALEYLLDNLGFNDNSTNVLPIYIGDDRTDEDAFKVLRERGEGYPILVSSKPRDTMAFHDPSEVLSFLIRLGRWGFDNHHHLQD